MEIATASASASTIMGAMSLWREIRSAQKEGREIAKQVIEDLGDKIRDAQDDSLAMRGQLQACRARAEEKNRYELFRVIAQFTTYRLKEEFIDAPDPVHHICPACFQEGKKSILQPSRAGRFYTIICSELWRIRTLFKPFCTGLKKIVAPLRLDLPITFPSRPASLRNRHQIYEELWNRSKQAN